MRYQVVEKESFATDWALVRDDTGRASRSFDDYDLAWSAARDYITDRNCNNALAKAEKRAAFECFIKTEKGIFLGILDGEEWYLLDRYGNHVDEKYFELELKSQVMVRPVPGT